MIILHRDNTLVELYGSVAQKNKSVTISKHLQAEQALNYLPSLNVSYSDKYEKKKYNWNGFFGKHKLIRTITTLQWNSQTS